MAKKAEGLPLETVVLIIIIVVVLIVSVIFISQNYSPASNFFIDILRAITGG